MERLMDTFVLQAIAAELSENLLGARLERISQTDAHTIVLFFSGARREETRPLDKRGPRASARLFDGRPSL